MLVAFIIACMAFFSVAGAFHVISSKDYNKPMVLQPAPPDHVLIIVNHPEPALEDGGIHLPGYNH